MAGEHARAFIGRYGGQWEFSVERRTGRPVLMQGSGIPMIPGRGNALDENALAGLPRPGGRITLDTLEPLARAFLETNRALLHPGRGELELDRKTSAIREDGRLASLYFCWRIDGVPVERANVFLRLNSGNVTQLGAPLVGPVHLDAKPALPAAEAIERLLAYTGDGELYRLQGDAELLIQPEDGHGRIDYRLVWKIVYRIHGQIETWEGRVDAHSGEMVAFRDTNSYARVVGGVYPRTVQEQNEVSVPFPFVDVEVDAVPTTADAAGFFAYDGGLAVSGLDGLWFDTACQNCSDPIQPQVQAGLGAGWLDFEGGGVDEVGNGLSTPADRNTFYHLNQVRRIAKKWLPSTPWLDATIASNVNILKGCNAFYDGSVNFFRSSASCNNTGEIADVIYHEWGHGVDLNTLAGDGATGEGTADVVSMHLSHSPLVGPGFRKNGEAVRNLDPGGPRGLLTTSNISSQCPLSTEGGPLGYEVHCEGEIYGQASWQLAQALVARHGTHTGWRTSERLFFTSLPDAGGYLSTSALPIYSAYLNADDDDGDLANGTPNAGEIHTYFDLHGIAGARLPSSTHCARPTQPALSVIPQCSEFDLSWDAVPSVDHYEIFRGELRQDQALFPVATVSAGQTGFNDSEVAQDLDYWYVVMAVDGAGCESTIEGPVAARLPDQPVLTIVAAVADDTPRGNRSGFADPGEEVDLRLSLRNVGGVAATIVGGTITVLTPDVTIVEGSASWPQLDPGTMADNSSALRFRAEVPQSQCGDVIEFRFDPDEASGCAGQASFFGIELGDAGVCDPTPACFVEPTFAGLESAVGGLSCGETLLSWQPGASNCENATLGYNVYGSTDPAFTPSPASLRAAGLTTTSFTDTLLEPGQTYHYIVRADDSRSGEDGNAALHSVVASVAPDIKPPIFSGLAQATTGPNCGEIELAWPAALESCNAPVSFVVYRGTDPAFEPGPENLIGSSLSTSFVDAALEPDLEHTYVVRARDGAGNEDANDVRITVPSGSIDIVVVTTDFEQTREGWNVAAPNDADTGNWEWGDPQVTDYQSEDCAAGVRCWITGLPATLPDGGNNDVDNGTTTLLSARYDTSGMVKPAVSYARWFTNDRGASPGEDPLVVEISDDDGMTWVEAETVGAGTPLAWVQTEIPFPPSLQPSNRVRFRFSAADLGAGSLVEAGIDEIALIDRGQGCTSCALPVTPVQTILIDRSGDDVVLDWSADAAPATRYVVYQLTGPAFDQAVRVGTTTTRSFVHQGAALSAESFAYRVSRVDDCGNESAVE